MMTHEQQVGVLQILKAQNEQVTELVVSMSALLDAIADDRSPVGDRYWRYRAGQSTTHDIVKTNAQVTAQIDRWLAELQP